MGTLVEQLPSLAFVALMYFYGCKGFTEKGIPLPRRVRLRGFEGKVVGGLFLMVGTWWLWSTVFSFPGQAAASGAPKGGSTGAGTVPHAAAVSRPALALQECRNVAGNWLISAPVALGDNTARAVLVKGIKPHAFAGTDFRAHSSFAVTYIDFPEGSVPNLEAQTTDLIAATGLTPSTAHDLTFAGRFPACEVTAAGNRAATATKAIARSILVGNRLYYISATAPDTPANEALAYAYLDSFKLIAMPEGDVAPGN